MSDRIHSIDALRGTALGGILIVNSLAFASVWYGTGVEAPGASRLDAVIEFFISAFFDLKFYLIFSFLFGYSVTLQMVSAQKAGSAFLPRMLRRQAGLFGIGALHAVFLFHGDILTTYAVLGLALLAMRGLSDKILLCLSVTLVVMTALFWGGIAVWQAGLPALDQTDLARRMLTDSITEWRGGPDQIIGMHLEALAGFLPLLLLLQWPTALAMFLLGFVAGRRTLFAGPYLHGFRSRRIAELGLCVGLPGALSYAASTSFLPGTAWETAGLALSVLTAPLLSATMIVWLMRMFETQRFPVTRSYLASMGRMALSNYLLQSLLLALVFHGYGLGQIDRLSTSQVMFVAGAIFAALALLSHWWLACFRYGPLEWGLRSLTLWRLALCVRK